MADGQNSALEYRQSSMVAQLVDRFMAKVEEVADDDDWRESDGWVGRMILKDPDKGDQPYVYAIKEGKMVRTNSQGPFVATMPVSVVPFLDLIDAAVTAALSA